MVKSQTEVQAGPPIATLRSEGGAAPATPGLLLPSYTTPWDAAGLYLSNELLGGLELADDLLRGVPSAFHGGDPAQFGRLRTLIHPGPISESASVQWIKDLVDKANAQ